MSELFVELTRPKFVEIEVEEPSYAKFVVEPLEKGYGTTLGNALRRVLLSSIPGAAITGVKIRVGGKIAHHEFMSLPGVVEDVTEIILNLKQVRFRVLQPFKRRVYRVSKEGRGPVFAGDIVEDQYVEVINKDLVLANVSGNEKLEMDLVVETGKGYVPVDREKMEPEEPDLILVDAVFSPIIKVNYKVGYARVGRITDYDKLTLEVWTDGTISPRDAVKTAVDILLDHFSIFKMEKPPVEEAEEEEAEVQERDVFFMTTESLDLSLRTINALKAVGIEYIGQLVRLSEEDIRKTKNLGEKSLEEIKGALESKGLHLGMELDWFPESKDEIEKIRSEEGIEG